MSAASSAYDSAGFSSVAAAAVLFVWLLLLLRLLLLLLPLLLLEFGIRPRMAVAGSLQWPAGRGRRAVAGWLWPAGRGRLAGNKKTLYCGLASGQKLLVGANRVKALIAA